LYALIMLAVGILISGFFSGVETGFYRATRVRLVLDARTGDPMARGLWWLVNRPAMFVATVLVANNAANYLTSMAIVTGTHVLYANHGRLPEILVPLVLTPLVFVYGELLPKSLFYDAPNRLLRKSSALLLLATVVLFIPSTLLWGLSKVLEWISGQSPQRVKLELARKELRQVLEDGHDVGILRPAQQSLAQSVLALANQPISKFATSASRISRVRLGATRAEILRLARRHKLATVPVEEPLGRRRVIGYVNVIDLHLDPSSTDPTVYPLMELSHTDTHITALMKMQHAQQPLARVVNDQRQTVGIVTAKELTDPLFRGG